MIGYSATSRADLNFASSMPLRAEPPRSNGRLQLGKSMISRIAAGIDGKREERTPAREMDLRNPRLRRVPTRWNLCVVMPVPGLDPGIVAGIHAFLAAPQQVRRGWPGQALP